MSNNGDQPEGPTPTDLRKQLSEGCPACKWLLRSKHILAIEGAGMISSRIDQNGGTAFMLLHWFMVNRRLFTHNLDRYGDLPQAHGGPIAAMAAMAFWTAGGTASTELPPWVVQQIEAQMAEGDAHE